ncbi:hypothetical protein BC832DRAFT_532917 [Gaertneriomyces semiglobifer]|nr:hypothetical protein BC832DRAFT_532917 [Gaertneriomyces semiglobifer]
MGVKEPPNFIAACQGTKFLTDHGVIVDYLGGYEQECLAPNKHIVQGPALTSFSLNSNDALRISISDPEKHGEGSSAFVSYAVTTKTLLDSFPRAEMSSRRRFQDFVWLNKTLTEDFPAVIIPPLPGKHRMEYITGDRFSPEFIEKRRLSLQTYMDRLSRHPILQTSKALRRFLETGDLVSSDLSSTKSRDSHVFENISDAFINAFAKVRKPDERFLEFKESVEKFEDNLNTVEKLHTKLLRQQHELERDTLEFAQCMRTLGDMETQITDPLADASESLRKICTLMKERSERDEMTFVGGVQEYAAYCQSVKEVLKLRDQKQVDYEELEGYLENYTADRDRTLQGRNGGGIAGFIKDKYNDFRNVNHEQARQTKLHKLEARISELREAAEQSSEISAAFSHEVIKELDLFQQGKIIDFKEFLRDYTESQMEFHQKGIKVWDEIIPIIESMDSATTSESI